MITISHNEIVVACRKAFEAKGFRLGQAEDGAEAIGWLAVHGLPLPAGFLDVLDTIKPSRHLPKLVRPEPSQSIWDAQGGIGMSVFPNLADYASVQAFQEGQHRLTLLNCKEIELIWPYASKLQKRGYDVSVCWSTDQRNEKFAHFQKGLGPACLYLLDTQSDLKEDAVELVVSRESREISFNCQPVRIDKPKELQANYLGRTENGISIDDDLWQRLVEIGKGLLVESTAESESRGAGGV